MFYLKKIKKGTKQEIEGIEVNVKASKSWGLRVIYAIIMVRNEILKSSSIS